MYLRVAITRPKERARETEELIRKRGWAPLIVPAIEIVPRPIDPSIRLEDFDWLVVTSASGVDVLWSHFKEELKGIDIAVVGPKTRAAFLKKGVEPKVVAGEHVGEGLASELADAAKDKKMLVARAAIARKGLVEMLKEVAEVTEIAIYDTLLPKDTSELTEFEKMLENRDVDAVVFTSSESAKNLLDFLGEEGLKLLNEAVVCAIGPITAGTLKERGATVGCMPTEYTVDAALDEIEKTMSSKTLS